MKKYLFSLLLVGIGFISFCSSEFFLGDNSTRISLSSSTPYNSSCGGLCCFSSNNSNGVYRKSAMITFNNNSYSLLTGTSPYDISCFNISGSYTLSSSSSSSIYIYPYDISSLLGFSSCPSQYTESECKSVYNLVNSSDLQGCLNNFDTYYNLYDECSSNLSGCMTNLDNYSNSLNTCSSSLNECNTSLSSCMSSNCPISSGNVSWSSLFINNIQHLGAPIIDITIPEEFDWDYVSTDEEFTLDIEGYNVDTEYMNGIIITQKTLPNDIDFNNIVSFVVPLFVPGIVIIFFLYFIFKFIKKIF